MHQTQWPLPQPPFWKPFSFILLNNWRQDRRLLDILMIGFLSRQDHHSKVAGDEFNWISIFTLLWYSCWSLESCSLRIRVHLISFYTKARFQSRKEQSFTPFESKYGLTLMNAWIGWLSHFNHTLLDWFASLSQVIKCSCEWSWPVCSGWGCHLLF